MGKINAKRPEHQAPPEIYYNEEEARKYTQNTHIMDVQAQISARALELLCLDPDGPPALILDLGCGSGLSGETITDQGHMWVGMDISPAMLDVAVDREVDGDVIQGDMGQPLPFRPAMFDGCISISAVQWLCHADTKQHVPAKRLAALFRTLFGVLSRGARAVFQFYPENDQQVEMIIAASQRAGFTGGVVVDFPNSTRAKKYYLTLMCGGAINLPKALGNPEQTSAGFNRRQGNRRGGPKTFAGVQERIKQKKQRRQMQGKRTKNDSKYSGRPRSSKF